MEGVDMDGTNAAYLNLIRQRVIGLRSVPEQERTREICLEATKAFCLNIEYVPENLRTEDFYLEVIQENPSFLEVIPREARTKKLCLEAFNQCSNVTEETPGTGFWSRWATRIRPDSRAYVRTTMTLKRFLRK